MGRIGDIDCVVYFDGICRALTLCEFLMKYKPYEVVYEWQWYSIGNGVAYLLKQADEEVSDEREDKKKHYIGLYKYDDEWVRYGAIQL